MANPAPERCRPDPALLELLERLAEESLEVLVPGPGAAHDAVVWAAAGHAVTTLDHTPTALRTCTERSRDAGVRVRIVMADVLHLPPALEDQFDAVWEQTCFVELEPGSRQEYACAMARALRPGGVLYGLFRSCITEACVRATFEQAFEILSIDRVETGAAGEPTILAQMRRRAWRPCRRVR